jgi:hypothetical protein
MPSIEPTNSAITALQLALQQHRGREQVMIGDLNLHHPYWGGENTRFQDPESEDLLLLLDEYQLGLLYLPGTTTYQSKGAETTIDLATATPSLQDNLIRCGVAHNLEHDSDHLPVETLLALGGAERTIPERWQWERTDKDLLHARLQQFLPKPGPLQSRSEIDTRVEAIVTAIIKAVSESTPKTRPSLRSVPGWTQECKDAQMEARRLRRQYQELRTPEAWEAYRRARNHKARLIRKTLRAFHRTRVREATTTEQGLWQLAKWARNREPRTTYIPPLQRPDGKMETEAMQKMELFRQTFFPPPPEVDLSDIEGYRYPGPVVLPSITEVEVRSAILGMPGKKAPGKDGIPSHLLHNLLPHLLPLLHQLYNACLDNREVLSSTVTTRPGLEAT